MTTIKNLGQLANEGKKFAYVKPNRAVSDKHVKDLKVSFESEGKCYQPLMLAEAKTAIKQGFKVYDLETNEDVTKTAKDYVVIIDGQHRYKAAMQLDWGLDALEAYYLDAKANIVNVLATVNNQVKTWGAADYASGATMTQKDNEVVKFIADCFSEGYNATVIGWILYQDPSKRLTKTKLSYVFQGNELDGDVDLETARAFVKAASDSGLSKVKSRGTDCHTKRYVFQAAFQVAKKQGWEKAIKALSQVTEEEAKSYAKATGESKINVLAETLKSKLN